MDRSPSFTFRLERVRALRERGEEEARERFAESLTQHRRGEEMLRLASDRVHGAVAAQRALAGEPVSGDNLVAAQLWRERVELMRSATAHDLRRRETEVSLRRDALLVAARDRQALERLKVRRREEHEREAGRRDQAVLDEIASSRAHRRAAA